MENIFIDDVEGVVAVVKESNEKIWRQLREQGFKVIAEYDKDYDMVFYENLKDDYIKPYDRKNVKGFDRFIRGCKSVIGNWRMKQAIV